MSSPEINNALEDILHMRQSLASIERLKNSSIERRAQRTHIYLLMVAAALSLLLIIIDITISGFISSSLQDLKLNVELRVFNIAFMGVALLICCLNLYFAIWRAAKKSGESFKDYVARNFQYLNHISHGADLFIKYCVVSALILAGRPEWVPPFLFLFIGDYLVQGRFFILPVRGAIGLGVLSLLLGFTQLIAANTNLLWPVSFFLVVTVTSLFYVRSLRVSD